MKESKSRKKINVQFEIDIPRDLEKFLHRRREHTIKKEKRVKEWNRTHAIRKKKGVEWKDVRQISKKKPRYKKKPRNLWSGKPLMGVYLWYRNTIK